MSTTPRAEALKALAHIEASYADIVSSPLNNEKPEPSEIVIEALAGGLKTSGPFIGGQTTVAMVLLGMLHGYNPDRMAVLNELRRRIEALDNE